MAAKKNQCSWKDSSPLGLLGILLITAGVIIAIYDAKDAIPNQSESYVVVIGVLLCLMGAASVVLAFLGYRRSRALVRENMGFKIKGKNKFNQRRHFRRVSISPNPRAVYPTTEHVGAMENGFTDGPSLVSLPQNYTITMSNHQTQTPLPNKGEYNYGFQKSPTHDKTFKILDNLVSFQGPQPVQPPQDKASHPTRQQGCESNKTSENGGAYSPPLPSWTSMEVAEYITPVSTTV